MGHQQVSKLHAPGQNGSQALQEGVFVWVWTREQEREGGEREKGVWKSAGASKKQQERTEMPESPRLFRDKSRNVMAVKNPKNGPLHACTHAGTHGRTEKR